MNPYAVRAKSSGKIAITDIAKWTEDGMLEKDKLFKERGHPDDNIGERNDIKGDEQNEKVVWKI